MTERNSGERSEYRMAINEKQGRGILTQDALALLGGMVTFN
jgi:hypothetical protein